MRRFGNKEGVIVSGYISERGSRWRATKSGVICATHLARLQRRHVQTMRDHIDRPVTVPLYSYCDRPQWITAALKHFCHFLRYSNFPALG